MMKSLDMCYLVTMGLALVVVTYVDGEEEEESTCLLSRVCQRCRCHINERFVNTRVQSFCPDPGEILDSVHITGGRMGCTSLDFSDGLLSTFQTRSLKLQNLNIRTLRNGTFRSQSLLEELSLRHNSIETIENGTLNDVTRLRSLDLTSNRLAEFPLSALTMLNNLTSLILSHNKLTRLDYPREEGQQENQQQHLIKLPSIERLHLSYNKITGISVEFINMFPKLSSLTLQRNRLVCDCHMAWLRDFRKCMCVSSYSQPCRQPQSAAGSNIMTYPLHHCPTSRAVLANCSAPRDCAPMRPMRPKPLTTRKLPTIPSGTWGGWGDSVQKAKTPTTKVPTTTKATITMATAPATLEPTDSLLGVVCAGSTQVKFSSLPLTFGIVLLLCTGLLQQWLIL